MENKMGRVSNDALKVVAIKYLHVGEFYQKAYNK